MNYWIGVASKDHVEVGVQGGFCQLCHGKSGPLKRMETGDWIIYYAPKKVMKESEPWQQFVAVGQIKSDEVYQVEMFPGFMPYRKDVEFLPNIHSVPLKEIANEEIWKAHRSHLRFGHFKIPEELFQLIISKMQ